MSSRELNTQLAIVSNELMVVEYSMVEDVQ